MRSRISVVAGSTAGATVGLHADESCPPDRSKVDVLLDDERGWLAIDPKGVIGELEYEVGAALRNPIERPALFGEPSIIRRRVDRFARELGLDAARVRSWAFAQAVLSVIWLVEDGCTLERDDGSIAMANTIGPTL